MTVQEEAMRLSRPEKLRLMEALWADLRGEPEDFQSPAWHEAALRETERRHAAGAEREMDWEEAKKRLREGR